MYYPHFELLEDSSAAIAEFRDFRAIGVKSTPDGLRLFVNRCDKQECGEILLARGQHGHKPARYSPFATVSGFKEIEISAFGRFAGTTLLVGSCGDGDENEEAVIWERGVPRRPFPGIWSRLDAVSPDGRYVGGIRDMEPVVLDLASASSTTIPVPVEDCGLVYDINDARDILWSVGKETNLGRINPRTGKVERRVSLNGWDGFTGLGHHVVGANFESLFKYSPSHGELARIADLTQVYCFEMGTMVIGIDHDPSTQLDYVSVIESDGLCGIYAIDVQGKVTNIASGLEGDSVMIDSVSHYNDLIVIVANTNRSSIRVFRYQLQATAVTEPAAM